MHFTDRLLNFPCLEQVIDRSPLIVGPNTSVLDAIDLMIKARGSICQVSNSNSSPDLIPTSPTTTSCVLVVEESQLLGVFTERDVVKLTAAGVDLSGVAIAQVMTREVITLTQSNSDNILTVLSLLRQYQIRHLPILDRQGQLVGLVTPETILDLSPKAHELQQIEESLREGETYRLLFEHNPQPMWVYDLETLAFLAVNQAAIHHYGYSLAEFLNMTIADIRPPEDIPVLQEKVANLAVEGYANSGLWRHQKKDGTIIDVEVTSNALTFLGRLARFVLVTDVTERQLAEKSLRQSEEKYRRICELTSDYIYSCYVTRSGAIIDEWATANLSRITGYTFAELPEGENGWLNLVYPDDLPAFSQFINERISTNQAGSLEYRIVTKQGDIRWICDRIQPEWDDGEGRVVRFLGATEDITSRKQAEAALRENNDRLTLALEVANIGSWDWNMLTNETIWTSYHETIFGYEPGTPRRFFTDWFNRIHPEDLPEIKASAQAAIASRQDLECEYRVVWPDGSIHWVDSLGRFYYNALGQPTRMVGVLYDISDRKQAQEALHNSQEQLQTAIAELTRSNKELEQFAYAASHDLQEPLRKINSFAELLAHDYRQQLDEIADKYIDYITDGATRMQALIEDLLIYSRVGRQELNKQPTDLNTVVSQVIIDLSFVIAENNAIITTTPLPTLSANPVQMAQLLQNLIANGIKFRRDCPPEIHIAATLQKQQWLISVQDNGIGIKPEYIERIFAIFQRLHSRSHYPGNGIGLALCRKIVERHGGQIWLESEPGKGTIFYFTIPA
ncbi:PAS domain-containing protein [Microseira sp. BLCC-F43]|jgi:PAS domain S-box-containing protein|uniref:PAS domain-containing protein n=1 Tax=Microseira sp. BLCC-F43 TaxID=3153602 RepID=UPI0035B91568